MAVRSYDGQIDAVRDFSDEEAEELIKLLGRRALQYRFLRTAMHEAVSAGAVLPAGVSALLAKQEAEISAELAGLAAA